MTTRRTFIKKTTAFGTLVSLPFGRSLFRFSQISETQTQTDRPNLLFIMTDQQRFDALSLAGNNVLKTPNLDRLAKEEFGLEMRTPSVRYPVLPELLY